MSATNGYAPAFDPAELAGKRVLIYSMGIEGRDLARFMLAHGASVTMSDTRDEEQLRAAGAAAPEGVERVVCGAPFLAPDGFELVAFSQFVLRSNPALQRAREMGIPMTSQMRLFLQLCPARPIGITGSSGKSTTTALVGAMAAEAGVEHIVGGNIGEALLGRLGEIRPRRRVILEISHTQLQYTDRSPRIAAITNITPNHLDQFSWDEYVGLKRHILEYQTADDVAVMNADDHTSRALMPSVTGRLVRTSIEGALEGAAAWFDGTTVRVHDGGREAAIVRPWRRSPARQAQPRERDDGSGDRERRGLPARGNGPRDQQLSRRAPSARGCRPGGRGDVDQRQHCHKP